MSPCDLPSPDPCSLAVNPVFFAVFWDEPRLSVQLGFCRIAPVPRQRSCSASTLSQHEGRAASLSAQGLVTAPQEGAWPSLALAPGAGGLSLLCPWRERCRQDIQAWNVGAHPALATL